MSLEISKRLVFIVAIPLLLICLLLATEPLQAETPNKSEKKIGIMIVSHGSRSDAWRKMLTDIEDAVRDEILKDGRIAGIRSAFMEYKEPSIATQMKEFDREGYTDVILIPLLLTVSSHSFDDIPTIVGKKEDHLTLNTLKLEGIEVYKPKAKTTIAPLLDFASVLEKNIVHRVRQMSKQPNQEGVVLVIYGSTEYEEEWKQLVDRIAGEVRKKLGIDYVRHAWCGHIVQYKSEPTTNAIRDVLEHKQQAIVVPVLVAVDEYFQGKIIGGGIKKVKADDRIIYRHDAILPDENVNRWVIDISKKLASELAD